MWFALAVTAALCQVLRNTVMKRLGHCPGRVHQRLGPLHVPAAVRRRLFVAVDGRVPPIRSRGSPLACAVFAVCQMHLHAGAVQGAQAVADLDGHRALEGEPARPRSGSAMSRFASGPPRSGWPASCCQHGRRVPARTCTAPASRRWAPLAVLFTDPGIRYTLLAALFFAPSVVTIKWAMQLSDPYMGTLGGYVAASLLITPLVLWTSWRRLRRGAAALEGVPGAAGSSRRSPR